MPSKANAAGSRRSLQLVLWAWVFGAGWMYIVMGAAATEYARSLGVGPFGFGLLAAVPFAGALTQLPMAYLIERYGHRKAIFITCGIGSRSMWLGFAAIPWLLPAEWWAPTLIGGMCVAMLLGNAGGPAWLSWAADLVPARIRGRYFSRRIQFGYIIGVVVTPLTGWALDHYGAADPQAIRAAISVAYIVAALLGVIDLLLHVPVPSPPHQTKPDLTLSRLIREPLADRSFRRFLGFTATLTFAVGFMGQFANLYVLEVLMADVERKYLVMNVMMVEIPLLVSIVSIGIWGRLMDRLGRRPVMVIAGLLMVNGGASWIFVTPENWYIGYAVVLVATFAWPAIELGNFNILVSLSGSRQRGGSSAYVAINALVVAVAGIASGLFGGAVAAAIGEAWRGTLFGWPLTYHGVLFLISAGLRLLALLWLIGIHEPGAVDTRTAVRYMAGSFYSNVQQMLFMPSRVIGLASRIGRLSFRLRGRGATHRGRTR
jgi:MFS family permease